jgi:molybdenum cofactor cytidylyltransferase
VKRIKTGAVIAAAGLSSRMNAFKPMLPLGDSTIIRTAISSLRAAGVSAIAVVTGHNAELLREHLADQDIDCLYNGNYAATDMFRSACIGLSYMKNRCGRLFFMPADVPLFSVTSLLLMMDSMAGSDSRIIVPACNGKRGHPLLIDNRAVPALLGYKGDMGLKGAMAACGEAVQVLELEDKGVILDADNPEGYRLLLQYANGYRTFMPVPDR